MVTIPANELVPVNPKSSKVPETLVVPFTEMLDELKSRVAPEFILRLLFTVIAVPWSDFIPPPVIKRLGYILLVAAEGSK
jgi:hypothetical protein